MMLPDVVYKGPLVNDKAFLAKLPRSLQMFLAEENGIAAYGGVLHVRGVCVEPQWHSLQRAIEGADSFRILYDSVKADDVPFAEDGFGNQYLWHAGEIFRLDAESGAVELLAGGFDEFLHLAESEPERILGFDPVDALSQIDGKLQPGQLISVYPPFLARNPDSTYSFRAIDALDCRRALASIARQVRDLPDGTSFKLRVSK